MSNHLYIVGLSFLTCLILSAVLFSQFVKSAFLRNRLASSALALTLTAIVGISPIASIFWYNYDFVGDISIWNFLLPLFASLIIVAGVIINKPYMLSTSTLLASIIAVFTCSHINIFPEQPVILNQLLTILILWLFSYGFQALSGISFLPQSEGITICGGLVILYFFGQTPFILCVGAAGILGSLLIAYIHSKSQPLAANSAPVLGFILGWLGLVSYNEHLLPCFTIFSSFYLMELLITLCYKITFIPKYKNIAYNSISLQASKKGLPIAVENKVIWNSNILLLIFGLFQLNSPSPYSIPLFAIIIIGWQLYRMLNWEQESKTWKETNKELIKELKNSFSNILPTDKNDNSSDEK